MDYIKVLYKQGSIFKHTTPKPKHPFFLSFSSRHFQLCTIVLSPFICYLFLTLTMASQSISQIDSSQTSWNVKVKVIRLWVVYDFNRKTVPFSVEMVLLDAEGGRIHATVKKTLIYKFQNDITEGNVYLFENMGVASYGGSYRTTHHPFKLNFQFSSRVVPLPNAIINLSPYHLVPISEIVGGSYDTDFLVGESIFNFIFSNHDISTTLSHYFFYIL